MNYTSKDCLTQNPIPVAPVEPQRPPFHIQLSTLIDKVNECAARLNALSLFLVEAPLEEDRIDEKTVSANLSYAIRMLNMFCDRLDSLNEFCR